MSGARHLKRLTLVWDNHPVYFITTCVVKRRSLLANESSAAFLYDEWRALRERHGWMTGRYVIMPDHVHFFVSPVSIGEKPLSSAIAKWKEWTAKRILKSLDLKGSLWQPEFFDHLLRSANSRSQKWDYVKQNPVRAGLVNRAEDWPYAGAIDFE